MPNHSFEPHFPHLGNGAKSDAHGEVGVILQEKVLTLSFPEANIHLVQGPSLSGGGGRRLLTCDKHLLSLYLCRVFIKPVRVHGDAGEIRDEGVRSQPSELLIFFYQYINISLSTCPCQDEYCFT